MTESLQDKPEFYTSTRDAKIGFQRVSVWKIQANGDNYWKCMQRYCQDF